MLEHVVTGNFVTKLGIQSSRARIVGKNVQRDAGESKLAGYGFKCLARPFGMALATEFEKYFKIVNIACAHAILGDYSKPQDRKSTRLNSSHSRRSRMPSSA